MFPGVVDIVFRYLPFDNFLSRPFATLGNLGRGARVLLTNTYHRIRGQTFDFYSTFSPLMKDKITIFSQIISVGSGQEERIGEN